ncbi:ATP-binding protein [Fulvivirga sediminis]|uniref:ATP-binding protein n=1 Tax=Fulvivirga sediminis TaxID=2803949 RepID=A0A937F8E0_9BACT|nr:ATP-binding protein [Fulvivirga sediminis]MBL3656175.1 ATP-binding protein [Fulvivirga sediminis]
MNSELQEQYHKTKGIVQKQFLVVLHRDIDFQITFLKQVRELQQNILDGNIGSDNFESSLLLIKDYKSSLVKLVERRFAEPEMINFDVDFLRFNQQMDDFIADLEDDLARPQDHERFYKTHGDSNFLRVRKWFKRRLYAVSKSPERFLNLFRKLFKKTVKPLRPWVHHIRLKNLVSYYFAGSLPIQLLPVIAKKDRRVSHSTRVAWQIDEKIEEACKHYVQSKEHVFEVEENNLHPLDRAIKNLEEFKKEIGDYATEAFEKLFSDYGKAYVRVGTMELSNSQFSNKKIEALHDRLQKQYKADQQGWLNTFIALSDDWEIDLELYFIQYAGTAEYHQAFNKLKHRVDNVIGGQLNKVTAYLEEVKERIAATTEDGDHLKVLINKEIKALREQLSEKILLETNELILKQDLPSLVNSVESRIDKLISSVSEKRAIVKGADYDQPIKASSINYISPFELIHFESWPQLLKVIRTVKVKLTEQLSQTQNEIIGLGQIAEFNMESALSLFEAKDKDNKPKAIAIQGVERTIEKVKSLAETLKTFEEEVDKQLYEGLNKFNEGLTRFTNNENIYDIRVRIAKGKALQKSKALKDELFTRIKNLVPAVISFVRLKYEGLHLLINKTYKRYGLSNQDAISAELADFLAETRNAIEKLPFVYQRLFKLEPLADINFFEGRVEEMRTLNTAYNNWMKGRFASSVLIGEKGSGATTLLNFYLKDLGTSSMVYRIGPSDTIYGFDGLINCLSESFNEKFNTMEELITFLNGTKKIMVLENIQNLYLKKVGGFETLRKLMEVIAMTNEKVFWVCSCTKYSWNYLDKTINLSDHFSYHISLNDMSDASIISLIDKRHRVSGYNLKYEPSGSELNSKRFKRLPEDEQQQFLRERYFHSLNNIAKSNVSLALVYWLRSTRQIEGNTIFIGTLNENDFSFMKSLSLDKTFALANIILHDGITEEEYSAISHASVSKVKSVLYPLYEDGVLMREEKKYFINPLLYRHTLDLLKSKNIIH